MAVNIAPMILAMMSSRAERERTRRRFPEPDQPVARSIDRSPIDIVDDARIWALPIDMEKLAFQLRFHVDTRALPDRVIATLGRGSYWHISLAPSLKPHVARFAIATLIGHGLFNGHFITSGIGIGADYRQMPEAPRRLFFFRREPVQATLPDEAQNSVLRFAVDILMPVTRVAAEMSKDKDVVRIAAIFGVTVPVMALRMKKIESLISLPHHILDCVMTLGLDYLPSSRAALDKARLKRLAISGADEARRIETAHTALATLFGSNDA